MTIIKTFQDQLAAICPDPVIAIDRAGIIVLFNQAAEQLLEYSASEVVGKVSIADLYHPHRAGHTVKRLMHSKESGTYGRIQGHESAVKSKSGRIIQIQISATLTIEAGQEVGSVGFFHDLTSRKKLEQSLRLLSITDNLSGLYNQRHFYATLSQEVARSRRYGHPLSMICIDMDNFKTVNDTLGHQEGDNLITLLGSLIRKQLRSTDFGFRYGGDEFMLILPQTDLDKTAIVAERLRKTFYDTAPTSFQPQSLPCLTLTLSIGIVLYINGDPEEQFIRSGDMAMYQAKESGGNRVIMAQSADQPHH